MKGTLARFVCLILVMMLFAGIACAESTDGAYAAVAKGFGGDVKVTLTIKDGVIAEVTAEGANETNGIGSNAIAQMPGAMVQANSVEVDGVSGATLTSNAILQAAQAALNQANGIAEASQALTFVPGTYEAQAPGYGGELKFSVTVSANAIEAIEFISGNETKTVGTVAIDEIPARVLAAQTLGVDTISGATVSSNGVLTAIERALVAAGAGKTALWAKKVELTAGEPEEYTADVVIIGGGGAGISAASAASELGSSVILIEKNDILGGNMKGSGGAINAVIPEVFSKVETISGQIDTLKTFLDYKPEECGEFGETLKTLQAQIEEYLAGDTTYMFDSIELHMMQMYFGGLRKNLDGEVYHADLDMVRTFCENAPKALDWVKNDWKMEFKDGLNTIYGGLWKRGYFPVEPNGVGYFLSGVPFAESHGAQLMTGITGKELIVNDDGRVVGVKAVKKDGTAVTLHANKGVVLATGGYAGNTKLVQELDNYWNGGIPDTLGTTNTSGITGDGLKMATAVGANLVGTDFTQLLPSMHPVPGVKGPNTNPETTIFVNKNGRRFVNEYAERDVAVLEVFKQPGSMYYTIDDDHMTPTVDPINLEYLVSNGFIWRADSIEDLAAQIDMDPSALRETVDNYNSYVDQGKDPEFGKNVLTSKIETPPFYAVPRTPGLHHTMGGVQIDTQGRVISVDGQPIAGLYAGGEVTGGIQGANRLGGNATADAIVFGRIAGTSASEMK